MSNVKTVVIALTWAGVLLFATAISIIRRRRSQGQTTVSPLDLTRSRSKKRKRREVLQELLFIKVKESTTNFKGFGSTGDDEDVDIEKGQGSCNDADGKDRGSYSNACAICLDEFEEGEKVVRSVQTKGCPHMFHESCMEEVISAAARKEILHIPCPCCRQTFVELEEVAEA